jgi:hypothetical protein
VDEADHRAPDEPGAPARFGLVLAGAVVLVVWILAGPRAEALLYAGVIAIAGALLSVVLTLALPGRSRGAVAAVAVVTLAGIVATVVDSVSVVTAVLVGVLAMSVASPVLLVVALVRHRRVDLQLLLGSISAYLLIGIAFAVAFHVTGELQDAPMLQLAAGPGDGAFDDHLYLSFVTLTTTGYGDITPASGSARALALLEALGGQVYLLTAVAAIVGLLTARRADAERSR